MGMAGTWGQKECLEEYSCTSLSTRDPVT